MNNEIEENRVSINIKEESANYNSAHAAHDEIKENRKFINYLLRTLNQKKNQPLELLQKECVEILRNCDKDITRIIDEEKNNFIHVCVREEKLDYLKALTEAYYVLTEDKEKFFEWFTMENSENMTPLDIAAQFSNKDIIKYLYEILKKTNESKLRLTERRNNLFHYAAKCNQSYPIIFFYDKLHNIFAQKRVCIINLSNQFGIAPLHYACFFGSRKVIDLLLDIGADINARDQDGATCLHYAINRGCLRTIKKLLLRGADKNIKKIDGRTAYDLALENSQFEIAKILEPKSTIRKYICMDSDLEPFKPSRNDLILLIVCFIVISFKLIYIFKINSMAEVSSPEYQNPLDNLPFVHNKEENKRNMTEALMISKKDKAIHSIISCSLDSKCVYETAITFITLFFDFLLATVLSFFMCCDSSKVYLKKRKNSNASLIVLYEANPNLCVICKDFMEINTVHCIVCNVCVDEWDHHCFWLNTCIHDKNKRSFKIFFYSIIISILLEAVFIFFNFFLSLFDKNNKFFILFFNIDENALDVLNYVRLMWQIIFGVLLTIVLYLILFVTIPTVKTLCEKQDKNETNNIIETKLLSRRSVNDRQSMNSYTL